MKCILCSFDLLDDWPLVKVTEEISGISRETSVCVPCQRRLSGNVTVRTGAMTPPREVSK